MKNRLERSLGARKFREDLSVEPLAPAEIASGAVCPVLAVALNAADRTNCCTAYGRPLEET